MLSFFFAGSRKKATFEFFRENKVRASKKCSGPENRDASILVGGHRAIASFLFSIDGEDRRNLQMGLGLAGLGWAGWAGLAGSPDNNIH